MTILKKDKSFLFWACLASLVVMYFLQMAAQPQLSAATKPISEEAQTAATKAIKPLSAVDFRQLLSTSDQPTFLVIYTSWCPYCRQIMPQLVGYYTENKLNNIQAIYLSVDKKPDQFINYMASGGYYKHFTPYLYHGKNPRNLLEITRSYNMNWSGGIPYGAFLDANGKLLADSMQDGWDAIDREIEKRQ